LLLRSVTKKVVSVFVRFRAPFTYQDDNEKLLLASSLTINDEPKTDYKKNFLTI
jgi:hypothetical protein